ncbi:MAG: hypothetical protein AAB340_01305 [Patescibacteria group bacterium]|mgnify:CR=1
MLNDEEKEKLKEVREDLILLCNLDFLNKGIPAAEEMISTMYDLVSEVLGKEPRPPGKLSGAIGFIRFLQGK